MRLIIFLCSITFLQCGINHRSVKQSVVAQNFKILRIDSVENVYMIYAMRNDSVFKILEKKESAGNCHRIVVNKDFNLKISSLFFAEESHVKMRVAGIKYEGVLINMEDEGIVSDLFTASNLIGTCFIYK